MAYHWIWLPLFLTGFYFHSPFAKEMMAADRHKRFGGSMSVTNVFCRNIEIDVSPRNPLPSQNISVVAFCASGGEMFSQCPTCEVENYSLGHVEILKNVTENCNYYMQLRILTRQAMAEIQITCRAGFITETEMIMVNRSNNNGPCGTSSDCQISKQVCTNGECKCHNGSFFVNRSEACYEEITNSSQLCQIDEQCTRFVEGASCNSSLCVCPTNFTLATWPHPACILKGSDNNGSCYSSLDCKFSKQVCIHGECRCQNGSFFVIRLESCYEEITDSNQLCVIDEQCGRYVEGSSCNSNLCVCPKNFVLEKWPHPTCIAKDAGSFGNVIVICIYIIFKSLGII